MTDSQATPAPPGSESFGVATLLGTAGVNARSDFDPSKLYIANGPLSRLQALHRIDQLRGPGALIGAWMEGKVSAWPSAAMVEDRSLELSPDQLGDAFRDGFTLYFRSVETNVPLLNALVGDLARDLGMSPGAFTCEAFVSSLSGGARMHFDPNMTFNIQLFGTKTWRVAENTSVRNPHTGFAVGGDPEDDILRYATAGFPKEMPADALEFKTGPGSVVYLPHGMWHQTQTAGASLALLFTVTQENWVSLIVRQLMTRLRDRAAWREIPVGLQTSHFWNERRGDVADLLNDLQLVAREITPACLAAELGGSRVLTYRLNDGVAISVERPARDGEPWVLTLAQGDEVGSRPVPSELGVVLDWIAGRADGFVGAECVAALPASDPEMVLRALRELERSRILVSRAFGGAGNHE